MRTDQISEAAMVFLASSAGHLVEQQPDLAFEAGARWADKNPWGGYYDLAKQHEATTGVKPKGRG